VSDQSYMLYRLSLNRYPALASSGSMACDAGRAFARTRGCPCMTSPTAEIAYPGPELRRYVERAARSSARQYCLSGPCRRPSRASPFQIITVVSRPHFGVYGATGLRL
jgi:hypothetical protein